MITTELARFLAEKFEPLRTVHLSLRLPIDACPPCTVTVAVPLTRAAIVDAESGERVLPDPVLLWKLHTVQAQQSDARSTQIVLRTNHVADLPPGCEPLNEEEGSPPVICAIPEHGFGVLEIGRFLVDCMSESPMSGESYRAETLPLLAHPLLGYAAARAWLERVLTDPAALDPLLVELCGGSKDGQARLNEAVRGALGGLLTTQRGWQPKNNPDSLAAALCRIGKLGAWDNWLVERVAELDAPASDEVRSECPVSKLHEMWQLWDRPGSFGVPAAIAKLALALWTFRVSKLCAQAPAVTACVSEQVRDWLSCDPPVKEAKQQSLALRRGAAVVFPEIIQGKNFALLKSELAIVAIEWLVTKSHEQRVVGIKPYTRLIIEGGVDAMLSQMKRASPRNSLNLRDLLSIMQHARFESKFASGSLLNVVEWKRPSFGRKASLIVELSPMLTPFYAHEIEELYGKTPLDSRRARQLQPILGDVAYAASPREYAAQRRMVWGLSSFLRERAPELAERGGVDVDKALTSIADESELPRKHLPAVREKWLSGGDSVPPLVKPAERGGWTLHESRALPLDLLIRSGKQMIDGKRDGEKGTQTSRALKKKGR